jgi:hypothetical protein
VAGIDFTPCAMTLGLLLLVDTLVLKGPVYGQR